MNTVQDNSVVLSPGSVNDSLHQPSEPANLRRPLPASAAIPNNGDYLVQLFRQKSSGKQLSPPKGQVSPLYSPPRNPVHTEYDSLTESRFAGEVERRSIMPKTSEGPRRKKRKPAKRSASTFRVGATRQELLVQEVATTRARAGSGNPSWEPTFGNQSNEFKAGSECFRIVVTPHQKLEDKPAAKSEEEIKQPAGWNRKVAIRPARLPPISRNESRGPLGTDRPLLKTTAETFRDKSQQEES